MSVRGSDGPMVRYPFPKITCIHLKSPTNNYLSFLDASSHLYNRVCPSVGPWVRGSVGPMVRYPFPKITCIHLKSPTNNSLSFLDASSHLYNRVCPSVGPWVRGSVGPWVRRSVTRFFRCPNLRENELVTEKEYREGEASRD